MALKAKQVYGALTAEVKSIVSGIASWSVDDVNKTITAVTTGGQTLTIHFTQPSDGVGVDSVDLVDGHIIVTYTDTTTHDAGEFPIPTIEVGTTETVEPTEPAEVTAEDTDTGVKLNFKIPRGESGGGGGEVTGVKGNVENTYRSGNVNITLPDVTNIGDGLEYVQGTKTLKSTIQSEVMPTPASVYLRRIIQYTGDTTATYTNGHFYRCVQDGGSYEWEEVPLGDAPEELTTEQVNALLAILRG